MQTSRLTSTFAPAICREPAARLVVTTAGSSCGVMPTAIASENSSASMHRPVQRDVDHEDRGRQRAGDVDQQHREPAQADLELGLELARSPSPAAIRPNSVRGPVATTTPRPLPAVHDRAHQRAAGQLGQRRPGGDRRRFLVDRQRLTGQHRLVALQAVHVASSRRSAGTISPSHSSTTSPGTRSVTSTGAARPSRTTTAWCADLRVQRLGRPLGPVLVGEAEPDRQQRRSRR